MWSIMILTYQINTRSEIITHGKRLRAPQEDGQKIQDWWKQVLTASQYLQSAGRPTSLVDLGDIVKAGTNPRHAPHVDMRHQVREDFRIGNPCN